MEWWFKCIKNYVNFKGRARRQEFWMFVLFNLIFSFVLGVVDNVAGLTLFKIYPDTIFEQKIGILSTLYSLFVLLPGLAVAVRRLHDVGKSGLYLFIFLIPLAGQIWLLVLFCIDGQHFANEYGPDPKAETAGENTNYINS